MGCLLMATPSESLIGGAEKMRIVSGRTARGRSQCSPCTAAGFSLVEVLVVIAVILIIAAIAIPRLLRSKMAANEAAAASALRSVCTVQVAYDVTYNQGYAPSLSALGPPPPGTMATPRTPTSLIRCWPVAFATATASFTRRLTAAVVASRPRTINANPLSPGQTGERYFYADQTNVIRWALGGPAGPSSPPVPQ